MAPRTGIHVYENRIETVQGLCQRLIPAIREIAHTRDCRIAVPGGASHRFLYQYLASSRVADIQWSRLQLFFSEESCGPADAGDSSYAQVKEDLLDRVPIRQEHVHRIRRELSPDMAALAYETRLGDAPLDIVLVRVHTKGLVPALALAQTDDAEQQRNVAPWHSEPGPCVSLTQHAVDNARLVLAMTFGQDKAAGVAGLLRPPPGAPPTALQPGGEMHWYLDRAAAAPLLPGHEH